MVSRAGAPLPPRYATEPSVNNRAAHSHMMIRSLSGVSDYGVVKVTLKSQSSACSEQLVSYLITDHLNEAPDLDKLPKPLTLKCLSYFSLTFFFFFF